MTHVPLVDLAWQHRVVADDIETGWAEVLDRTAFTSGPAVAAFETAYAAYLGSRACIGVANGTDALELALRAAGIGPGDEVIIPANTFIATAEAVVRAGATPVVCDVDDRTLQIDPDDVAQRITGRTAAVIPVHLHGHPAPMPALRALAGRHGLFLLEDAAQAQGATVGGRNAGTWGDASATSFYPGKNLGAYGDAGAITTDDDALAQRIRRLRDHGSVVKYEHEEFGATARLDTLQAVVLNAKLTHLDAWNHLRADAAARYRDLLTGLPTVRLPRVAPGVTPVWHCYVVRVPDRDAVLARLHAADVGAGVHYPTPVHRTAAWQAAGFDAPVLPVAERAAREILSLPMFPGLTFAQQEYVAEMLEAALRRVA